MKSAMRKRRARKRIRDRRMIKVMRTTGIKGKNEVKTKLVKSRKGTWKVLNQ